MSPKQIDFTILDDIVEKMISTVDESKDEIFNIGEQCREDFQSVLTELEIIREKVKTVIKEEEELYIKSKHARVRLSEVSKDFQKYSEDEIRKSYEVAHEYQMNLLIARQKEKQLIERRNELERRLTNLQKTIDRADQLASQINVVLNYLTQDMKKIGQVLEDARLKQDFGLQIMQAQEEERKRLSREIHDGPAQMMANILMRSDLIDKLYKERGVEDAFSEIRNLKKMVRSALYEVRRIIYDLRPMALDDLGLIPTLKKYLSTIEEYNLLKGSTRITFKHLGLEERLASNLEIALFRLIQESVQNALKHADAKEITVKIEISKHRVMATIRDDGKGFDLQKKREKSFGIIGMRERVELLEGEITIDSKLNKGTLVMISVPHNI